MQAGLNEIERQIHLAHVCSERLNQGFELRLINRSRLRAGIGFALVPQDPFDLAAKGLYPPNGSSVQRSPAFALLCGIPLVHAGSAMGAGNQSNWNTTVLVHADGERHPRTRAFLSIGYKSFESVAGHPLRFAVLVLGPMDLVRPRPQGMQWIL